MNTFKENPKLFRLLVLLTLLTAVMLRGRYLFDALEYDEIWSLENFATLPVARIFTELALPNNQPLNSLWIKFTAFMEMPVWCIRLLSFAAGLLTLPLVGFICYVLSGGRKYAALWSMIFLCFSVPDVTYSALARGYALQVCCLALYGAGLASTGRWRPKNKLLKYLPETGVLLGGVGAILTLPTSVMYLTAITLAAFLIRPGKPGRLLTLVLIFGAVFSLSFCIANFHQLNAARVWGTQIRSGGMFMEFLWTTLRMLLPLSALLAAIFALVCSPSRRLPLLLIFFIPLIAAAVTNGGPPRTYIPFCAVLAVAAGCGVAEFDRFFREKYKVAAAVLFIVAICAEFSFHLPEWKTADWGTVYRASSAEPLSVLVVHRATSSYPLAWNNQPHVYTDFVNRLLDQSEERDLVMFDGPGRINGIDAAGSENVISIGIKGKMERIAGLECRRYRIRKLSAAPEKGSVVLIVIRPLLSQMFGYYYNQLKEGCQTMLKLNPYFHRQINLSDGSYSYALYAVHVTPECSLNWEPFLHNNGMISVYGFSENSSVK